ncbi:hypothetical protein [Segatella hominis]|uniref:hypothetical protein n=1 Tax=Segatella hominis TaxID=2518605 RepID=UPI0021C630C1|nr:hypothetical protein [Segatella hominis]
MDLKLKILNVAKRFFTQESFAICSDYVQKRGQMANDYIYESLNAMPSMPLMCAKFGTTELDVVCAYEIKHRYPLKAYLDDFLHGRVSVYRKNILDGLCRLSGFFPNNLQLGEKFYNLVLDDMREIDVLASYIYEEKYIAKYLNCVKVDLDGYYAPFMWQNPWTKYLKGKKVLVVHPFVDSIRYQYEHNRDKLFDNPDVLPEFKELLTVKAVQTISDQQDERFDTWFDALQFMKDEISKLDFDIALIGCGAYGMCLAAHVKRMGKQAVHLAGWTQMLFGVYGERWIKDQPQYSKYINEYWIRPLESEKPKGAEKVENGCYW